jgi:hypothetical protein
VSLDTSPLRTACANDPEERIADVLRSVAQSDGEWRADILQVWPEVDLKLELFLQRAIHYHPVLEAVLQHEFFHSHPLFSTTEALKKYVLKGTFLSINQTGVTTLSTQCSL